MSPHIEQQTFNITNIHLEFRHHLPQNKILCEMICSPELSLKIN
jgi:hypothetical protein